MNRLIPGNVYSAKQLQNPGKLYKELKVFPTPFKGIYYVPFDSERAGWYVSDPHKVIFLAAKLYLRDSNYYFGLYTALYYLRIIWNAFGVDLINKKLSRRINRKRPSTKYWRGKTINKIMKTYPFPIRFHRMKNYSINGITKKGIVRFSNLKKTKQDARYLSKKGDRTATDVLKLLKRNKN